LGLRPQRTTQVRKERLVGERGAAKHALRRWQRHTAAQHTQRQAVARWQQRRAVKRLRRALEAWEVAATQTHGVDNDEILAQVGARVWISMDPFETPVEFQESYTTPVEFQGVLMFQGPASVEILGF
jgi:hypothetical protein